MDCPVPNARVVGKPEGTGSLGVLILGEALGRMEEEDDGLPFRPWGEAGSVVERAIRRAGFDRQQFVLYNVVPCHPPSDWLVGAPWEQAAVEWGRRLVADVIAHYRPRVILALGEVATRSSTGLAGNKLGVGNLTGFLLPNRDAGGIPVIPCYHPSYLRRGAMGLLGVLIRCIRLAVQVAREERQPTLPPVDMPPPGYLLRPTELEADLFARSIEHGDFNSVAYDIETAYSTAEDSAEEIEENAGVGAILSIQFSTGPDSGIYLPWREPFIGIARRILASGTRKLSWNGWKFDDPLLRAAGCAIGGESHDLMWAWHHLQPDLPRGLQFVAGQLGWPWPWKHLDAQNPAFYGITDVAILQWMLNE